MIRILKELNVFIKQLINQLKFIPKIYLLQFSRNDSQRTFAKDGYIIIKNYIDIETIKESLSLDSNIKLLSDEDPTNGVDVISRASIELEKALLSRISDNSPSSRKILGLIKSYLGSRCLTYSNGLLILPERAINEGSWQPHHDSKFNKIKIYLWISPYSKERHPLYFIRGSHKKFKFWKNHYGTRYPKIPKKEMLRIDGNTGDLILFDTHGVHSFFKDKGLSRSVYTLNLDPIYNKPQTEYLLKGLNGRILNIESSSIS